MTPALLAKLVLESQAAREDSWKPATKRYSETIASAACLARMKMNRTERKLQNSTHIEHEWVGVVTLLNSTAWNDVQAWAKKLLNE